MKKQNSQFVAALMIFSMVFSFVAVPVLAESGRGAADDLLGDSSKSANDIPDLRGDGTPEDNLNDDSPDLRGDGTPEDNFGDDEFPDLRGDGTLEDNDNLNDNGVVRDGLEVRAFAFGGISQIKVEMGFSPASPNRNDIVKDAFDRVKQLDRDDVSSVLRVRNKIEQMREDSEISIQTVNGVQKAAVQMRFSLNTDESSNSNSMISAIMGKIQKLKLEDLQNSLVEDNPKGERTETETIASAEKKTETESEDEKSRIEQEAEKGGKENAGSEKTEVKSKGFLDGVADFFSGIFGFILGSGKQEEQQSNDDISTSKQATAETRLAAQLSSANNDLGKAEFTMRGERRKLSVEVENMEQLGLAEGGVLSVFVNNIFVGDAILAADPLKGIIGDLNIDTVDGEKVPAVKAGDDVKVLNALGGTVLTGKFSAATAQPVRGFIPFESSSGPGYPTGPLEMDVPAAQLMLNATGQVKGQLPNIEITGRKYEGNGAFPVVINGISYAANEIKVISNLKAKNGAGQHSGTIDVDIDAIPGGHITLQYQGTATIISSTTTSSGTFKSAKATDTFTGLVAEGTYMMTITETGDAVGSVVTVTITTTSATAAAQAAAGIVIDKTLAKGPGYPTGPLNLVVPSTQLFL